MHWGGLFDHHWLVHLGPVYLATVVFVVRAGIARKELRGAEPAVERRPAES